MKIFGKREGACFATGHFVMVTFSSECWRLRVGVPTAPEVMQSLHLLRGHVSSAGTFTNDQSRGHLEPLLCYFWRHHYQRLLWVTAVPRIPGLYHGTIPHKQDAEVRGFFIWDLRQKGNCDSV